MALELEQIQPWDGQSGTGAEVRGALNRNFEKLKRLSILAGISIKDIYDVFEALPRPGVIGENYLVGNNIYIWSQSVNDYVDGGNIKGIPGDTPYVKNGNWWIDGIDTNIVAVGKDGKSPIINEEWGKSASTTVPPTIWKTNWLETQPVNAGEYLWFRNKYTYQDGTFQYSSPHIWTTDGSIVGTRAKVTKIRKSSTNISTAVTIIPDVITNNTGGFTPSVGSSVIQIDLTELSNYEPFIVDGIVFSADYNNYFCYYNQPYSSPTKSLVSFFSKLNSRVSESFAPPLNAKYLFFTKDRVGYYSANFDNITFSRGWVNYTDLVKGIDNKKIVADKVSDTYFKFAADRSKENVFSQAVITTDFLVNQVYEIISGTGWKYAETDVTGRSFVMLADLYARPDSAVYWRVIDSEGNVLLKGHYKSGQEMGIILPENSAKFQYDIKASGDVDSVYEKAFVAFSAKIIGINEHSVGGTIDVGGDVEFNSVRSSIIETDVLKIVNAPVWDEVSATTLVTGQTYLKLENGNYTFKVKA